MQFSTQPDVIIVMLFNRFEKFRVFVENILLAFKNPEITRMFFSLIVSIILTLSNSIIVQLFEFTVSEILNTNPGFS